MPHGGYDHEDCITELELVKIIMEEGPGAKDFLVGGKLELKLGERSRRVGVSRTSGVSASGGCMDLNAKVVASIRDVCKNFYIMNPRDLRCGT